MTAKQKKTKAKPRRGRKVELQASADEAFWEKVERQGADGTWERSRKRLISLRVDPDVLEWFQSYGPGYQTRIHRILRRVMEEGKKRKKV